ncbi:MAG: HAD hydrolase family protein [Bacteroidota bacterium]|nr:HAD hydrolase family protein [Bacteroidota bacterium]
MENFKTKLTKITTFMFDMDGVLTNGQIMLLDGHEPIRNVNSKDGYAIHLAQEKKYNLFIVSGGKSQAMEAIFKKSGYTAVFMNQRNKLDCYNNILSEYKLKNEEILYMGDDLPDWNTMKQAGVAACPADAAQEIKDICIYVSQKKGGEGCVRDIIEQVMRVRGDWEIADW